VAAEETPLPTPTISPDRRAPAEQTLLAMVQAYQLSQSIYVAAKLGVPDVLAAGPQTPEAIAVAVGARAPELRRVLRALVAAGIFTELQDGRFELDDAGDALLADAPGRLRDITINFGEEMYRCFGELLHTVRTGQTAFEHIYGQQLFDYYAEHPEAEASGSARMLARSLPVARELAATDLLSGVGTVVDVGGGPGTVIAELLKHDPRLSAVLLERPSVLGIAHHHLSRNGMADRCRLTEGDFFESVPPGGDVYLLKSVLHDWNDERCLAIPEQLPRGDGRGRPAPDRGAHPPRADDRRPADDARRVPGPDHAGLCRRSRTNQG
jgi:hypothetical protein